MNAAAPMPVLLAYLAASVLFILGLKRLSHPKSARGGNGIAALGMAVAVAATFFLPGIRNLPLLVAALVVGSTLGLVGARAVSMTAMPQMVALLNGLGGGAAALVSIAEFRAGALAGAAPTGAAGVAMVFGAAVGTVAFVGSLLAFAKLQGVLEAARGSRWTRALGLALAVALLGLSAGLVTGILGAGSFTALVLLAVLLAVILVLPIGGADMPVVISLLNSSTGLAAAATGFILHNVALIIAGTLVGASGALLTQLMCKAMNRSLANVLSGSVGAAPAAAAGATTAADRTARDISVEDTAVLLANVHSLVVVPGYGMAVAQAQHAVRELADELMRRGVQVRYAIHPVAGRMPGHMNVLLAEANVPYEQLFDLEQINPDFEHTDAALVIGANDVVNPAARSDPASPIYGMPILDVDKARHVIVVKRSMKPGFAGIDNDLYYRPNTYMLFGDARQVASKLVAALREGAA